MRLITEVVFPFTILDVRYDYQELDTGWFFILPTMIIIIIISILYIRNNLSWIWIILSLV